MGNMQGNGELKDRFSQFSLLKVPDYQEKRLNNNYPLNNNSDLYDL